MQLIPLANSDEVDRVRFEESARMAQKLDDSNIARVFDVGIEDDHLVFATEYLEGETAKAWIDAHGPMPADAVLRIGHQVMNALAAAATHSLTQIGRASCRERVLRQSVALTSEGREVEHIIST